MKWLISIHKYIPDRVGGTAVYVKRFIDSLLANNHEVTLITSTNIEKLPEYEKNGNLEVYKVYFKTGSVGPLRFKQRKIYTDKINEILAKNHFDIVNIHTSGCFNDSFFTQKRNYKLIFTLHAVVSYELLFDLKKTVFSLKNLHETIKFPMKYLLQSKSEKTACLNADKIIVMSEYVKGTIKKYLCPECLNKVCVTGIGVSPISDLPKISREEARDSLSINKNDKLFVTVRRLVPRMGLFNLIKAFSFVKDDSARLLLIGKGQLYENLNNYIKKLNLQDKVKLVGYVENDLLHYYYCTADCFILPTEELEGFGISTIEALSYNLPVIGTPRGATPEILTKFDKNLITRTHKPKDLYEKIEYYLKNQDKYRDIDFDKKVNNYYNWNVLTDRIINSIYAEHKED